MVAASRPSLMLMTHSSTAQPSRGPVELAHGYAGAVNLGAPELLIVLVVVLVLFGGAKLPKLARSLGQAQNEFKKGVQTGGSDDPEIDPPATPPPA
jgi:sec-independent protein translocase protein TatA